MCQKSFALFPRMGRKSLKGRHAIGTAIFAALEHLIQRQDASPMSCMPHYSTISVVAQSSINDGETDVDTSWLALRS